MSGESQTETQAETETVEGRPRGRVQGRRPEGEEVSRLARVRRFLRRFWILCRSDPFTLDEYTALHGLPIDEQWDRIEQRLKGRGG